MIANLIAGHWCHPHTPALPVYNPATEEVLDEVPLSGPTEVTQAVAAAAEAYAGWSQTPVMERTRLMFRYKALLEEHGEELAALVTRHHGKTLDEARGDCLKSCFREYEDVACHSLRLGEAGHVERKLLH
jgi:malonate-semialdehyde dehydrogenase (acetylating)/methylmalonate-semialdehyde dehydrogenase